MKYIIPFLWIFISSEGYHLNSTRDEKITTNLWQKYGQMFGGSQLSGENFAKSVFRNFKCASVERTKLMEKMKTTMIRQENFIETCNEILFHVILYGKNCTNIPSDNLPCENRSNIPLCIERFLAMKLFSYDQPLYHDEDPVEKGLKEILEIGYNPRNDQCFSRDNLFRDITETGSSKLSRDDVKFLSTTLILHLSKGDCISIKTELDFITDIFDKYGTKNDTINMKGLERILLDVGIEREHKHDHNHNENEETEEEESGHDHHHDHDHSFDKSDAHDDKHEDFTSGRIELMHFSQESGPSSSSINNLSSLKYDTASNKRRKRDTAHVHSFKNSTNDCWTADDLFHKFDADHSKSLNRDEFLHLCPALIQQKVRGKCDEMKTANEFNLTEVYGYATLTVLVISLCSLFGVILMPIKHSNAYQYIMMCFIALAFGTLTGDALLHLIPEAIGLHVHEEHEHEHDSDEIELPEYFWKFIALLAAIYGLFVVETLSHMAMHNKKEEESGHGHSHIPNVDLVRMATKKDEDKTVSTETLANRMAGSVATLNSDPEGHSHSTLTAAPHEKTCWGLTTLAIVIIVGDGIHNIADGLTIGAAFTSSVKGGISSALAIFFHELPHEFGDFVILLSTGLSYKKALMWNFISSLTAFIGLFIGIELGENAEARRWILAIAAGMFLYIALGDMLPELKSQKAKNRGLGFLAQNFGVLLGMIFMIVIGVFEEKIQI